MTRKDMNYEEKYKEALERAKKFEEKYGGDYAGYIFPELKESEDERIRRKMIEHFKAKTKETWCNMPVKDIIAYLEKQKEQKPVDLSEMMVHKEPYIAPVPTPMVADEQKPAEWSEEQDYSGLSDLERAIHRGFLCGGAENVPVAIIKETAKEVQSTLKAEG